VSSAGERVRRALSVALLLAASTALHAHADDALEPAWLLELGDTPVHQGGRERTAGQLHERLRPSQQRALAEWIGFAQRQDWHVVVPKQADALIFGAGDLDELEESADTLDDTWELFAELQPVEHEDDDARDAEPTTTVFFLFDAKGHAGASWPALLEELAVRGQLVSQAVSSLRDDPNSLTQRQERLVLPATYDLAGDASQGDDEFRLQNELAHKLVWMLLLERFGRVPAPVEWGLGYVAEQRLFRSIYLFDRAGFVAADDHLDWPKKAREMLIDDRKDDALDFARVLFDAGGAGRAVRPQMQAWALLDLLLNAHPERLATLLSGLAELHREGDVYGIQPRYAGDSEAAAALIMQSLELAGLDSRDVEKHVKRVK